MVIIWYKRKRDGDIEFIELMNSMEFNGIQFLSEIHCYWIENFFFFFGISSKNAVKKVQDTGKICVFDIDIEGVKNLKKTDINPLYIFVKPPSIEVLVSNLKI